MKMTVWHPGCLTSDFTSVGLEQITFSKITEIHHRKYVLACMLKYTHVFFKLL